MDSRDRDIEKTASADAEIPQTSDSHDTTHIRSRLVDIFWVAVNTVATVAIVFLNKQWVSTVSGAVLYDTVR